eukprot:gnl/Trimastix_PCT/2305.p1 GENE.gnl/Trimastix_PCT/2305~~gnl/Trimastix_PCT/2305.p1  ORF type:complete len:433 (+),score=127.37 gnl/Trimastix_PCT/2305:83-1381(+)
MERQAHASSSDRHVIVNLSKRENVQFKSIARRLRSSYRFVQNKDVITPERLSNCSLIIFGGSREKFSALEVENLKRFIEGGGSVLVCMGEGGEQRLGTNINFFLEEYGINANNDSVVRTVYEKYPHPKEALIRNGILNRELNRAAQKGEEESLAFVYPFGSTLTVQKPAIPLLSSGDLCYPLSRPLLAVYTHPTSHGRLAVSGSYMMFDDNWSQKEDNFLLLQILFKWLHGAPEIRLNAIDADDPDVNDYHHLPNTAALSEHPRGCMENGDPVPLDVTQLFNDQLCAFDMSRVPEVIGMYKKLDLKHETLTLIPPQFEAPLPRLHPAVFPPALRDPPPPPLELFDLDEHFASDKARLAQLTNKCTDDPDDLAYYIAQAGEILGVRPSEDRDPRLILDHIFRQIMHFRKLNQDALADTARLSEASEDKVHPAS